MALVEAHEPQQLIALVDDRDARHVLLAHELQRVLDRIVRAQRRPVGAHVRLDRPVAFGGQVVAARPCPRKRSPSVTSISFTLGLANVSRTSEIGVAGPTERGSRIITSRTLPPASSTGMWTVELIR